MADKAKKEVVELRFATPEEEAELIKEGRIAPKPKERPVNQDVIDHPEKYYCPICGASFASHKTNGGHTF